MSGTQTRMRRVVERENQDIDSKLQRSQPSEPKYSKQGKRKTFQCPLLLVVLSPLLIIGSLIYALNQSTSSTTTTTTSSSVNNLRQVSVSEERKKLQDEMDQKIREQQDAKPKYDKKYLVLLTKHGDIQITLRPDLSPGSVDYIYKLVESYGDSRCMHCQFYRSEKPGILQGIMENEGVVPTNQVRGDCPEGAETIHNDCPPWDSHCGCHGPLMTRGAVAWAAGEAGGPDFFIDGYPDPADWWGTQHTNFGVVEDEASFDVIATIFDLPIEKTPDMDFIKDPVHFDLRLK